MPLIGHEEIVESLRRALARGRLGHAFLFVGPEGVGKRRVAEHVAQGLFCETNRPETLAPCGRCAGCLQVEERIHPDFFVVNKPEDKHELPIAVIQELCANLSMKPARGERKIAIVDDADTLNEEAANCFLKTLEEPAPGSLLILIASSIETQMQTIVSRCQSLCFSPLPTEAVCKLLVTNGIADSESSALPLAELGQGSIGLATRLANEEWRDARRMLFDGLSSFPAGAIDLGQRVERFIEEAGKESALKRGRARQLVGLATDFYRHCLRMQNEQPPPADPVLRSAVERLVPTLDIDRTIDLVDRCLQAEFHIARFLHQAIAVDCWIDDLAQITAGDYVPAV